MKQIKTKLLKTIWNNIHREEGLSEWSLTDMGGGHCAIGCTFGKKIRDSVHNRKMDEFFSRAKMDDSIGIIMDRNDSFEGTESERRIYMLKFIGEELMRRGVSVSLVSPRSAQVGA